MFESIKQTSIFNPSAGTPLQQRTKLAPTGFSRRVPYYILPDEITGDDRMLMCVYLAFCGTSTETSVEKWKTWVLSYVAFVTPSLGAQLPPSSHVKQTASPVAVQGICEMLHALEANLEANNADGVNASNAAIRNSTLMDMLPRPGTDANFAASWGEWTQKVVMCHYSIMLFMAGKRVSGNDHSQVTIARPRALKGKVHLEGPIDLLEGACRMSDIAHVQINNAWAELSAARAVVFAEYARYSSAEADEMQNIIWTTMHLLRFSNMAHAAVVFNFLQSYPWVFEIPALRPSLACYARSVLEASRVDRDILPYVKLIYGDKSSIFPRKELEPLIACAVHALSETQPTLAAFYSDPAFAPIVDIFERVKLVKEKAIMMKGAQVAQVLAAPTALGENEDGEDDEAIE
jgi:hypothetical protein